MISSHCDSAHVILYPDQFRPTSLSHSFRLRSKARAIVFTLGNMPFLPQFHVSITSALLTLMTSLRCLRRSSALALSLSKSLYLCREGSMSFSVFSTQLFIVVTACLSHE